MSVISYQLHLQPLSSLEDSGGAGNSELLMRLDPAADPPPTGPPHPGQSHPIRTQDASHALITQEITGSWELCARD